MLNYFLNLVLGAFKIISYMLEHFLKFVLGALKIIYMLK